MSERARALAERLEEGATRLAAFAESLSDAEWQMEVPRDGRTVAAIVHHVASNYPIEIGLAETLAQGKAVEGITWDMIHDMNARHGHEHAAVARAEAVALLRKNSAEAGARVRKLSDDQLDRAAPVSLSYGAPLTAQYLIENHALRHSYHHLGILRGLVQR